MNIALCSNCYAAASSKEIMIHQIGKLGKWNIQIPTMVLNALQNPYIAIGAQVVVNIGLLHLSAKIISLANSLFEKWKYEPNLNHKHKPSNFRAILSLILTVSTFAGFNEAFNRVLHPNIDPMLNVAITTGIFVILIILPAIIHRPKKDVIENLL